jgi:hypothetical protein
MRAAAISVFDLPAVSVRPAMLNLELREAGMELSAGAYRQRRHHREQSRPAAGC